MFSALPESMGNNGSNESELVGEKDVRV
jgi:hypothetical protein